MNATLDAPATATKASARREFPTPRPNALLMWVLGYINRWFILRGLPVLRHIPGIRNLPGIRGYLRVRLDLPQADRDRLTSAVNPETAAFLSPNHPEFGADWMIDKEISTLVAPEMASWAANEIIRGAPSFWRANNLVSNAGGDAAMEYSIGWALAGKGVLLHPEGSVHWTADKVHQLFPGIAEMATETARRAGHDGGRHVFIVPIVWKLRYLRDVSTALHRDMLRIERPLGLPRGDSLHVVERFHALQENILALQAQRFGFTWDNATADFFDRQDAFRRWLVNGLESRYPIEPSDSIDRRIRRLDRAIRAEKKSASDSGRRARLRDDLAAVAEALRLGGFSREVYATPALSQEQIAESLKRLRAALVKQGTVNTLHNYLPRPYGARVAHVRVPEPIRVDARLAESEDRAAYVPELLERTQAAMQAAVDDINVEFSTEIAALSHPNPFV